MKKNPRKVNNFLKIKILIICFVATLSSCNQGENRDSYIDQQPFLKSEDIRYAEGFQIEYFEHYTRVIINNPWTRSHIPYEVYYLYKDPEVLKNDKIKIPTDGIQIQIPIKSVSVNTFSYFEFLSLIDELSTVTGVTDGLRVYNPEIRSKLKSKEIIDLGDPFNPNIELTMTLKPDAIINSAYAQLDNYSERLDQTGFPVIYSLEWMEDNPLARAEWIKMIASFYNKNELAENIFNEIEEQYFKVQGMAEKIDKKKSVLSGDNFQGTWYVPGGNSFNAKIFRDAGLSYLYENNNKSGSVGLDIESILIQFGNADIWFGCDVNTYSELVAKDSKYLLFNSVKKRQVFNNHERTTPLGGNDYFESAIAYPNLILSDIIKAAYPQLLPNYSYTYIRPLE